MKKIVLIIVSIALLAHPLYIKSISLPAVKSFCKDASQYMRGDTQLDPVRRKRVRNVLFGAAGIIGITTGITALYFLLPAKHAIVQQEVFNPKDYLLEVKSQGRLAKIKNQRKEGLKQAQQALDNNDIEKLKDAIQNKRVLYHKHAADLINKAKSAEAIAYIMVNFPLEKRAALLECHKARLQQCIMNRGDSVILKRLIATTNQYEATQLLMDAVMYDHPEAFLLLVDNNGNVRSKDKQSKKSALQYAQECKFMDKLHRYKEQYPEAIAKIANPVKKTLQFAS